MLKNYAIIAIRAFWRNKTFSIISIASLALGISVFVLAWQYVRSELSYDSYHTNADRIVLVYKEDPIHTLGTGNTFQGIHEGMGGPIKDSFPEVQDYARVSALLLTVQTENHKFYNTPVYEVDQSFFTIFTFEPLIGDLASAVSTPGSAVLTESEAIRLFGKLDVIGRTFELATGSRVISYRITAVIHDLPATTHFNSNIFIPWPRPDLYGVRGQMVSLYILLNDKIAVPEFAASLPGLKDEFYGGDYVVNVDLKALPLEDIHLSLDYTGPLSNSTSLNPKLSLFVFLLLSGAVLLLACNNYLNMSLTGILRRLEEIGIRKTVGAERQQVMRQFLFESVFSCLLAAVAGLGLARLLLFKFGAIMGRDLSFDLITSPTGLLQLGVFILLVSLVSGGYPAYVASKVNSQHLFRGASVGNVSRHKLERGLVVFQFATALIFILTTATIINQMRYMRAKRLNVDENTIIHIDTRQDTGIRQHFQAFKDALIANPSVRNVTFGNLPGSQYSRTTDDKIRVDALYGTYDLAEALGLKLIQGRYLQPPDAIGGGIGATAFQGAIEQGPDSISTFTQSFMGRGWPTLVNETALRVFGIEDNPIGQYVSELNNARIVGVVEDFHLQPLRTVINPTHIQVHTRVVHDIIIRFEQGRVQEGLAATAEVWQEFAQDTPFNYRFLSDILDDDYRNEIRILSIMEWFGGLVTIIAVLGLYGLVAFAVQRRTKEIGIRKVVGASVTQVVTLLSKEFLMLVLIANIIAWPIAWFAMNKWLQNFAYRIDLGLGVFLLAGLLALGIALATVSWQTIRAATANPVEALRYE